MAQRILRPLDYGELLDEMFDLYKRNFLLFAGIAGVVHLPVNLIVYSIASIAAVSDPLYAFLLLPVGLFITIPLNFMVMAATTWAVSQSYLGRTPTILSSYQAIKGRALAFIGTMLALSLIIGAGFMLCFIPGIIFSFWYAFISEVFVLEGKLWSECARRSKALAEGQWVRILVVAILAVLIQGFAAYALTAPVSMLATTSSKSPVPFVAGPMLILQGFAQGLANTLTTPIMVIAFVLLYYDIRIRKEGFDLELLAASLGETLPPGPAQVEDTGPAE